MKVWVLHHLDYGYTDVFAEDTDVLEIPAVKEELSWLTGGYEDEREEFIEQIERIKRQGRGSAHIEERFDIELQEVG